MKTRPEGVVNHANSISCEEENTCVVFQDTKKHYEELILGIFCQSSSTYLIPKHCASNHHSIDYVSPGMDPKYGRCLTLRLARKTSASSRRRTQPQRLAKVKRSSSFFSTCSGWYPISPEHEHTSQILQLPSEEMLIWHDARVEQFGRAVASTSLIAGKINGRSC